MSFAMAWRRRSKLDDSALIGGALVGYTAFTLGGWLWLLGPLLLFLVLGLFWPRSTEDRPHTAYAILAATASGLFWLFAYSITGEGWLLIPFTGSFAAQLTLYGVSRFGYKPDRSPRAVRLLGDIGLGWGRYLLPHPVHRFRRRCRGGRPQCPETRQPRSVERPWAGSAGGQSGRGDAVPVGSATVWLAHTLARHQPHLRHPRCRRVRRGRAALADWGAMNIISSEMLERRVPDSFPCTGAPHAPPSTTGQRSRSRLSK